MKKILALLLTLIVSLTAVGCDKGSKVDTSKAPDYSTATGEFTTYGYHSPVPSAVYISTSGDIFDVVYEDDGVTPKDFRTVERYREYLEAGLNTMFIQANDPYRGEENGMPYDTSDLKKNFQTARDAGIDKVILSDTRLHEYLSAREVPIWDYEGAPTLSASEQATQNSIYNVVYTDPAYTRGSWEGLVNYVKNCLKDYIHEPNFYGVMLQDEPNYKKLPQVAYTYRAIKEAFPLAKAELEAAGVTVTATDIFVQENLFPYYGETSSFVNVSLPENAGITHAEAFKKYVNTYIEMSNADNITMDSYPMKQQGTGADATYYIVNDHFPGLQMFAEAAKATREARRAADDNTPLTIGGVAASTELANNSALSDISLKAPTQSDMYYQLNSYMMFGFTSFGYYTYWAKTSTADYRRWGTTYINRDGSKTPLYYIMQDIHAEMQELAPTIMQFEYQGLSVYKPRVLSNPADYFNELVYEENGSLTKLKTVTVGDDQIALVTELFDDEKNQYMYAIMNPQAPGQNNFSAIGLNATMEFDKKYSAVKMYFRGEWYILPLSGGKLNVNLSAGHAAYIMPF